MGCGNSQNVASTKQQIADSTRGDTILYPYREFRQEFSPVNPTELDFGSIPEMYETGKWVAEIDISFSKEGSGVYSMPHLIYLPTKDLEKFDSDIQRMGPDAVLLKLSIEETKTPSPGTEGKAHYFTRIKEIMKQS